MELSANVFASRRERLLESMGEGTAMLLFGARHVLRNGDAEYPYRQDSDLWYLTGWKDPESALLLIPGQEEASILTESTFYTELVGSTCIERTESCI